ncbi:UNVERIFIED_CONTAM: putative late blight resistance proteinR1B-16 [Sesamum angustifolium]|uniref:Late blight resistance proteinR1B-16 n=1 Tax=Sesamum angustifolium TaxID=2727405 RepID=A0AAW2QAV2_9LAMI
MAAYAALVSLARTIHLILQNHYHSIFFHEFNQQINHILDQCTFLQAFLEDFPNGDDELQARIRDVANEAEDVILDFLSQQIESHLNSAGPSQDVQPANQSGMPMASRKWFKLPKRYQRQGDEEDEEYFQGEKPAPWDSSSARSSSQLPAPSSSKGVVVGFEDDLMAVKHRLCGQSSKLQVVPILGMGGIGKTTLARNAYDDQLTVEHFQVRAWVTISQDYSIQGILSNLLVSIKPSNENQCIRNNELMAENVYKGLKGMRYLIVMDDMWSTKFWDDVKMIFPDDDNGSRIIITTRLLDVASYMGSSSSSPPHEMHFLDEDQTRSCGGLPLAIVVIAGLLSTIGKTRASWENIAENVNLAVTTNYEQFAKILSLSYIHLPQHLRPCFLYLEGFPENYEIHIWKLIKLWVAEGFIKPSESKSFEEEAEYYLEDLVKRSLVLVTRRKTNGKIKICGVHDLVRDLCIRKAQEEKFLHLYVGKMLHKNMKYQHRISFMHFDLNSLENMYGSTIHTIICLKCRNSCPTLPEFCSFIRNFRLLKTSRQIPATISNLQNLQTLILHQGKAFKSYGPWSIHLPLEIWRIPQLRHPVSFVFGSLPDPEGETFPLENVQTLSEIRVNLERLAPSLEDMGIVGSLPNLEVLKLRDYAFRGYKWETSEEEFHCLKFLLIDKSDLQHWITESSHFPNLKCLLLYRCLVSERDSR